MKPSAQNIVPSAGLPTGRNYIIAGGTGFIGRAICRHLLNQGNSVVILTRGQSREGSPRLVQWDGKNHGPWTDELEQSHGVINLAGRTIDARHTATIRKEILESRVNSVSALRDAVARCHSPPQVWLQASAIGIYGDRGPEELDETARPGQGILSEITEAWEAEFAKVEGVRKVVARFGVVLGEGGGAFPKLQKLTKLFLGGTTGSGGQFISWIHLQDLVRAADFVLKRGEQVYNFTAPHPVNNREMMQQLRHAMGRPWSPPAPEFAIRLGAVVLRTQPELILESARVFPKKLLREGFSFLFPNLQSALKNLVVRD